jgi:histidinol phosphatase-like PHP family hydrolase
MGKVSGLMDLHTHSLLSDGILLPSELVRRYEVAGFKAVAITDHVDHSDIDFVISGLLKVCKVLNKYWKIKAFPGVELTHIPVQEFSRLTKYARKNGARIVVAHGESLVEPVIKGTNRAAIEAGVDILAHPGKISKDDARLAAKKRVLLELTTRKGHCLGNRSVASAAKEVSAKIVINSDFHSPEDMPGARLFSRIGKSAGLSEKDIQQARHNSETLIKKILK